MMARKVLLDAESEDVCFLQWTVFGYRRFASVLFWDGEICISNAWFRSPFYRIEHLEQIVIWRQTEKIWLRLKMKEGWSAKMKTKQKLIFSLLGRVSARWFPPPLFDTDGVVDAEVINPEVVDDFVKRLSKSGFKVTLKPV
jgi:hypothetical protein